MKQQTERKIENFIVLVVVLVLAMLIWSSLANAEDFIVQDGIPEHTNQFERPTAVSCWDDAQQKVVTEVFTPPKILRDFGNLQGIFQSPVEAQRTVEGLKTCGIAQWHYWLLKEVLLQMKIRHYSGCVDQLSTLMYLNGELPINDPNHPFYPLLKSQVEYLVAFEGVQPFDYERDPYGNGLQFPGVRHYQEHILAAIASVNITAGLHILCEETKVQYTLRFLKDFTRRK